MQMGSIAPFQQHDLGPEDHSSTVWLIALYKIKDGFAVKIAYKRLCRKNCPVAARYWIK